MIEKLRDLRLTLEQLKQLQSPTVGFTNLGSVDFSIAAFNRTTNDQADSSYVILVGLNPLGDETIFALPEMDLFGHPTTPALNSASLFPDGSNWSLGGNSNKFYDLDVWHDLWNNELGKKQTTTAFIRGRSPYNMAMKFVVRWRTIIPI